MDIDKVIEKNTAKYEEKLKKRGVLTQGINNKAKSSTKYVNPYARNNNNSSSSKPAAKPVNNAKNDKVSTSGSIASKARMVKEFNEKNNK